MEKVQLITPMPLRQQVADIIRRMIMDGDLKPGQQVSERNISAMLEVSTTPVKEAFRVLQAEGLLYSIPRKGSFVSERSLDNLMQYSYMRSALEGVAARFAAQEASKEDLLYMEKELAASRELIENDGDRSEISRHNLNYHVRMRKASKNAYLVSLISMIADIDNSMREVVNRNEIPELMQRQEEHEAILNAVRAKMGDTAEKMMIEHVRNGAVHTLKR